MSIVLAATQTGDYEAMVVGLAIGGVLTAFVVRRAMRKPGAVGATGRAITDAERRLAMQTVAAIYAGLAATLLIVAIVVWEPVFLALSALVFAIAVAALARTGLPRDHPAWRRLASISRR